MEQFFTPHLQRFMLRVLFGACAFLWTLLAKPPSDPSSLNILILVFLLYSAAVLLWERRRQAPRRENLAFAIVDILFVGVLIALTGGGESELHLLLYFVVAMRAPYRSWTEAFVIPGVATVAAFTALGSVFRETHWSDFVVRILLLWFLAIILRVIGLRSVVERQRSEKLAQELFTTHEEVRSYTAALEKANAEKEKHLTELNLLHRFVLTVRGLNEYDPVYDAVLKSVHSVCEPAWLHLLHRRKPGRARLVTRTFQDPPKYVTDWIHSNGIDPGYERDGEKVTNRFGQRGDIEFRYFIRCHEQRSSVTLILAYPMKEAVLLEEQVEILSALMDTVEMELELLRLRRDLAKSNQKLSESNRHLTRLHELQHELNKTFLARGDVAGVIESAQEIMAKDMFELDRLNLFLPDEDRMMLQCFTSVGIGDYPLEKIAVPMDGKGGAISKSFREGRTIFFDGSDSMPDEYKLAPPYSEIPAIRSRIFVIVPLIDHHGKVVGVIGADRKYTHRPIPHETVTMLEFFARHVAMVISFTGNIDRGDG